MVEKEAVWGLSSHTAPPIPDLLGMGGLARRQRVPALEEAGEVLERLIAPGAQHVRMNSTLSSELADGHDLLQ